MRALLLLFPACDLAVDFEKPQDSGVPDHETAEDTATTLPDETGTAGPVDADADGTPADADCDDADASVHPGAAETCDGRDEDCDGAIDEDTARWYADLDGDGFGDPERWADACDAPGSYVADASDCDDDDRQVHPDAEDACWDGVDADCDGGDPLCAPEGEIDVNVGIALRGELGDKAGYGAAVLGDTDGDGASDVLVGGIEIDDLAYRGGGFLLALGPVDASRDRPDFDAVFASAVAETTFGWGYSAPGDLDGDGLAEILVGCPTTRTDQPHWGASAALYYGGARSGTNDLDVADVTIRAAAAEKVSGSSTAPAGDTDGDGTPEFVFGGPWAKLLPDTTTERGAVFLVQDPPRGDSIAEDVATAIVYGSEDTDYPAHWGNAMGIGDGDGDGLDDLLIGAVGAHEYTGSAYLFRGPLTDMLTLPDADAVVTSAVDRAWVGAAVAPAGDQDGDGLPDFLVSALEIGDGQVSLFPGPTTGEADMDDGIAVLHGTTLRLAAADFDADGAVDVISCGYLFYGPLAGSRDVATADAHLYTSGNPEYFGYSVAAGDVNGDPYADLLIGSPSDTVAGTNAGAVFLLLGGPRSE